MKEVHILLVEDNEGDIVLTLEALKDAKLKNVISVARDGEEAIDFISKKNKHIDAQSPDLILLDINLPKVDGKEVLHFIKSNDLYKHIPVIMLTTSNSEKDILDAYKNYANCYISKPVNLGRFLEVVQSIENFWISIVHLPKH